MATSREYFALDWIKSELLETLNKARAGLESFAESLDGQGTSAEAGDALRECVNGLHQVHGTLVMLELKGVTLLADHLERVAEALLNGDVKDVSGACQGLMQGILELPGYLEELQSGLPDSEASLLPLTNELRALLGEAPLERPGSSVRLYGIADDKAVQRFQVIGGVEKTKKIRAVYQQVLLSLLKGGNLGRAVETLRKVAQGMIRVCEGTPFAAQWQAFSEFVEGLALAREGSAALDGGAVKLLRRVDSEIREVVQTGSKALQRPVSISLVRQLLEAAADRGRTSALLDELRDSAAQGEQSDSLSLSGRQALVSAAGALREELSTVKDRLDLFVRSGAADVQGLGALVAPLKQVASTLSLLGFESSKSIVLDQVEVLSSLVEANQADEGTILNVAGALVQVDENLASLTHGGKGEVEKITDEAQRAVAQQTREGLDQVKQSIVDYVSSQWDVRHLQQTPAELDAIAGALNMIPLAQAAEMVQRCHNYLRLELMAGHVPTWDELDRLADALSGIDYYLERLASDNPGGAEDVLDVVQRSLDGLTAAGVRADGPAPDMAPEAVEATPPVAEDMVPAVEDPAPAADETAGALPGADPADEALFGAAGDVDIKNVGGVDDDVEPELDLEADEDFDLANSLFDEISGETSSAGRAAAAPEAGAGEAGEEWKLELEDESGGADPLSAEPARESSGEPAADPLGEVVDDFIGGAAPGSATQATAPPASLADTFESDDEIVEIFVEEVDEVLEAVDEHLSAWDQSLDDESHQSEIRRAFHTLKGSGRMVGANVLGEMAWSVENMLNRLLDGTVQASAEFVAVVRQARELAPSLKDAFEQKTAPEISAVGRVMEQADILASGGTLADAVEFEAAGTAATVAESSESTEDDQGLFVAEAEAHLGSLQAACVDDGFVLNDDAMRALHTLSGSAAMAGLATVGELASPANELAQALRKSDTSEPVTGEHGEFFRRITDAIQATLADMKAGREPEEHYQLIADADRLLMDMEASAGQNALLGLPALDTLAKASVLLTGWKDGAVDLSLADDVREALVEVERTARGEGHPAVTALASALIGAHERFEFESLNEQAFEVFAPAHEALLTQFDALAADQSPADAGSLCTALDALQPPTESEEPAAEGLAAELSHETGIESFDDETSSAQDDSDEDEFFSVDELAEEVERSRDAIGAEAVEDVGEPEPASAVAAAHEDAQAPVGAAADASLVPDEMDEDIIAVFFEEADEILESLDQSISDWSGESDNRLHLENILRGLHTLKGGARLSGLTALGDETHEFESYVIEFQESEAIADPSLFDALHSRYDELAALLARTKAAVSGEAPEAEAPEESPGPAPSRAADFSGADLSGTDLSGTDQAADRERAREAEAPAVQTTTTQRDNVAPLRPSRPAAAGPEPQAPESRPEPAAAQARTAQEMVRVGAGLLESLVNLAGESSIIRARVEQGMSDFTNALDEMETTIDRLREQLRRLEIETEAQVLFRQEMEGPDYEDFDPLEMDRYSQLQQLSRALGESASDMLDLKETLLFKAREAETLLLQQARVNTELQEGLMRSRMVPFSRLLPRLKRTVRQVARELDKEVELQAFNVEGELDRTLLERMVPPLEHMLRNAVDHGIEAPGERRSRGKAKAGRIDLRLSREGGDVVIEISDDGAGIDVQRVRAKAVERGLMAADANLRDEEISQFVLAPGFSTAASVTQISGRGVGMDVVHSEVKQLGGSINIVSQPGKGTRFVVRVPFTVSVNRALMVSVGDDLYAIPLNTIEGIVLLSADELEQLYLPDGNTFEYAGVPYRVQYLGNFLGREYHPQPMQSSVPVVLVRSGEHAVAVHVDGVQGSREIVVKSLGPQFAGVGGISGATILGDGSVVVILDLLALIRTQSAPGQTLGKRGLAGAARTRCVMVVDDSVTVRKVTSRLLERQGMDVVVAKDGVEAVSLLQERRPDVMLLDIEMPRMDGFEVLRQVRHDEHLKDLPIVMISSRTGTKHQDRAAELGVSRFLGKPFQESELLSTIDELVG